MSEQNATRLGGGAEPIVAAYREKILYALAVIATVVLLPFSIGNFVKGYPLIGAVSMAVVLIFVADAAAIYLRRRLPVPIPVAFVVIMIALVVAIWGRGLLGIFWTFPAILLFHFVLERRLANLFNLTLVALVGGVAFYTLDADVALRIVAGQLLTIVFTNIFSYVVEAEQRKETEQRRRLGLLVRATQAGFYQWDRGSEAVTYSGRLKEMLGHDPDADTSGWPPFPELVHPEDRERALQAFPGRRARPQREERRAAPRRAAISACCTPTAARSGCIPRACSSTTRTAWRSATSPRCWTSPSATARRRHLRRSHNQIEVQAQQLRDQNAALRDAIRVREEVERIARHDLKTPLNSILAALRLLREKRRPDEREERAARHGRGRGLPGARPGQPLGGHLPHGAGRVPLQPARGGPDRRWPRPWRATCARTPTPRACASRCAWAASPPASGTRRAYAWAEEMLCYSVIANLLKNAVEASPDGAAVRIDFDAAGAQVVLRMHNDGVVPASVRAQRSSRSTPPTARSAASGLGTYSARLMARVQQGELSMQTSEAEGTVLELRLPALPEGVAPIARRQARRGERRAAGAGRAPAAGAARAAGGRRRVQRRLRAQLAAEPAAGGGDRDQRPRRRGRGARARARRGVHGPRDAGDERLRGDRPHPRAGGRGRPQAEQGDRVLVVRRRRDPPALRRGRASTPT